MNRIIRGLNIIIKDPRRACIIMKRHGFFDFLNDNTFHKIMYWAKTGRKLDLKKPKGFNEKLHWLMIHDKNPSYTDMVDKYRVREYIKDKIGEQYLIPLIQTYAAAEEIDFDELPEKFVIKCNHNSGSGMCICKNKKELDIAVVKTKLSNALKRNYYNQERERPYKNVEPIIVCEEYMEDKLSKSLGVDGLLDYKFYCFNGVPKFLYVSITKENKSLVLDFYDMEFHKTPFYRTDHEHLPFDMKKPVCFEEMKQVASTLSKDIPFVRVDLYQINNKVYFSELTFYPGSGYGLFSPEEWERKIGDMLQIDL